MIMIFAIFSLPVKIFVLKLVKYHETKSKFIFNKKNKTSEKRNFTILYYFSENHVIRDQVTKLRKNIFILKSK